jgi:multisubunit Na+/H+ antiporter MnhB subunit
VVSHSITGVALLVLLIALDEKRPAESRRERIAFAAAASLGVGVALAAAAVIELAYTLFLRAPTKPLTL